MKRLVSEVAPYLLTRLTARAHSLLLSPASIMAPHKVLKSDSRTGLRLSDFRPFRNHLFGFLWQWSGGTVTHPFEDELVGTMAQSIDGDHVQHPVGREGISTR